MSSIRQNTSRQDMLQRIDLEDESETIRIIKFLFLQLIKNNLDKKKIINT